MASFPNLVAWESDPNDTLEKLAAVGALLKYFDHNTAVKYSIKLDMLAPGLMANNSLIGMRTVLASAIADLTLAVDPIKSQIYGPGATYDFYLNGVSVTFPSAEMVALLAPQSETADRAWAGAPRT